MKKSNSLFFLCGLLLFISECWKQFCLTWVVSGGTYQWWHFPFQLCSIPMYLCLLLPFTKNLLLRRSMLTFLADFGLLGGIFAFFDTSGMHYSYFPLTLHSFLWHFLLIFIGIMAGRSPENTHSRQDCLHGILLYLICCAAATGLNILFHPFGNINLFYISPYCKMEQLVFADIAAATGNTVGILIYIAASILGSIIFHFIQRRLSCFSPQRSGIIKTRKNSKNTYFNKLYHKPKEKNL